MDRDEPESNVMTGDVVLDRAFEALRLSTTVLEAAVSANSTNPAYIPRFIYVDRWNRKTTVESYFSQLSINIITNISC